MYISKKRRGVQPKVHRMYTRYPKSKEKEEHKSKKLEKEQLDIECSVTLHENMVCSTNFFKLSEAVSQASKLRAFSFFYRHHIKHKGAILQIGTNSCLFAPSNSPTSQSSIEA